MRSKSECMYACGVVCMYVYSVYMYRSRSVMFGGVSLSASSPSCSGQAPLSSGYLSSLGQFSFGRSLDRASWPAPEAWVFFSPCSSSRQRGGECEQTWAACSLLNRRERKSSSLESFAFYRHKETPCSFYAHLSSYEKDPPHVHTHRQFLCLYPYMHTYTCTHVCIYVYVGMSMYVDRVDVFGSICTYTCPRDT